jgi:hypothetical protein
MGDLSDSWIVIPTVGEVFNIDTGCSTVEAKIGTM